MCLFFFFFARQNLLTGEIGHRKGGNASFLHPSIAARESSQSRSPRVASKMSQIPAVAAAAPPRPQPTNPTPPSDPQQQQTATARNGEAVLDSRDHVALNVACCSHPGASGSSRRLSTARDDSERDEGGRGSSVRRGRRAREGRGGGQSVEGMVTGGVRRSTPFRLMLQDAPH